MLAWNKRGVTDDVVRLLCSNMCGLSELDLGLCGEITCSSLRVSVRICLAMLFFFFFNVFFLFLGGGGGGMSSCQ